MASSPFFSVMDILANSNLFPFFIALFVGIPSALLYCLELFVIITNFATFNSAFFVLVALRAISSLINFIGSFVDHRFGKIGLFLPVYLKLSHFVLALIIFFKCHTFHMENLLTALLSVNRLTAILLPTKYERLWRRALPLFIVGTIIFPLPFTASIFNLNMYIHVQPDNVTFTLDSHKMNNQLNLVELATWSSVIFCIICLMLNLATLFAYKLKKNVHQNSCIERKMTLYAVFTFVGHLLQTIFLAIVTLTSTNFVDGQNNRYSLVQAWFGLTLEQNETIFFANFNQFPWINDLSMLAIPAWLLLWASTKMNEIICKKFQWLGRTAGEQNAMIVTVPKNVAAPTTKKVHPIAPLVNRSKSK